MHNILPPKKVERAQVSIDRRMDKLVNTYSVILIYNKKKLTADRNMDRSKTFHLMKETRQKRIHNV